MGDDVLTRIISSILIMGMRSLVFSTIEMAIIYLLHTFTKLKLSAQNFFFKRHIEQCKVYICPFEAQHIIIGSIQVYGCMAMID